MKKRIALILLSAFAIAALTFTAKVYAENRTLSKNLPFDPSCVFIPGGTADRYEDFMKTSFDDHRIWIYKLKKSEITEIEKQLSSLPFQAPDEAELESLKQYWFGGEAEKLFPKAEAEDLLCLFYSRQTNEFYGSEPENAFCSFMLLYDKKIGTYYGVTANI